MNFFNIFEKMSDKKRKEELKEKYEAIFSGEHKRLKTSSDDDISMHKLFNIIIIKINMIKFYFNF
jgi:vacuolar-type H+-ATPase subunit H